MCSVPRVAAGDTPRLQFDVALAARLMPKALPASRMPGISKPRPLRCMKFVASASGGPVVPDAGLMHYSRLSRTTPCHPESREGGMRDLHRPDCSSHRAFRPSPLATRRADSVASFPCPSFPRQRNVQHPTPLLSDPPWDPGTFTVKVLPLPGSLLTSIEPPWASTMNLTMLSPRPHPPAFLDSVRSTW